METLIAWGLTTLVALFIGSYLASYLKKKGKNLATHEHLEMLVEQVRAVTTATKESQRDMRLTRRGRRARLSGQREAQNGNSDYQVNSLILGV